MSGLKNLIASAKGVLTGKPAFVHAERDLAAELGLGHEALKQVRVEKLERGTDWDMAAGLVSYSATGRAKALAALKITTGPAASASAGNSAANTPSPAAVDANQETVAPIAPALPSKNYVAPRRGDVRELVCSRMVRNRRIVLAVDAGVPVWVRVKDSKNFRRGLKLRARFLGDDHWELVGRCPRYPGKF